MLSLQLLTEHTQTGATVPKTIQSARWVSLRGVELTKKGEFGNKLGATYLTVRSLNELSAPSFIFILPFV